MGMYLVKCKVKTEYLQNVLVNTESEADAQGLGKANVELAASRTTNEAQVAVEVVSTVLLEGGVLTTFDVPILRKENGKRGPGRPRKEVA